MSQQSNTVYKTFIAGADLTGKENLFVELTGDVWLESQVVV